MHFIWKGKSCLTCKNNKSVVHQKVFIEEKYWKFIFKKIFCRREISSAFLVQSADSWTKKMSHNLKSLCQHHLWQKKEITITVVQYCETVLSELCVKWIGHVGSASQVINNGTLKQAHFFNSDNKSDNCFVLECTCLHHFDRWC